MEKTTPSAKNHGLDPTQGPMDKRGIKPKTKALLSDISLLFVALVWGGGFIAVKDGLNTMTPMVLMALRFTLAAAILFIFLRRWIGPITLKDWQQGGVVGSFLFLAFAAQTYGLQYTTASKQGFLTAVYVVVVPLLSWLIYKKRPAYKAFIGSALTLTGIGLMSLNEGFSINLGDSLTLLCAVLFAAHILAIEYFARTMNTVKLAFIQIAVAAAFSIVVALVTEPLPSGLTGQSWVAIIYLAVFSTFACFTVQTIAQKYTTSSHASIIMSLESVFAAVLGVWLLKDVMTSKMIMGSVLIFAAILIVEVEFKKRETSMTSAGSKGKS